MYRHNVKMNLRDKLAYENPHKPNQKVEPVADSVDEEDYDFSF